MMKTQKLMKFETNKTKLTYIKICASSHIEPINIHRKGN